MGTPRSSIVVGQAEEGAAGTVEVEIFDAAEEECSFRRVSFPMAFMIDLTFTNWVKLDTDHHFFVPSVGNEIAMVGDGRGGRSGRFDEIIGALFVVALVWIITKKRARITVRRTDRIFSRQVKNLGGKHSSPSLFSVAAADPPMATIPHYFHTRFSHFST